MKLRELTVLLRAGLSGIVRCHDPFFLV